MYQRSGKYMLPKAVYNHTVWQIRDYDRLKDLDNDYARHVVGAIDECLQGIPEEYRCGVWRNIQYRQRFPDDAGRATYGRYKSKYIHSVAKKLGYV